MPRPAEAKSATYHVARLSTMQRQVEADERMSAEDRSDILRGIGKLIVQFQTSADRNLSVAANDYPRHLRRKPEGENDAGLSGGPGLARSKKKGPRKAKGE